jgi:thioesterase domain-containing protein/acyl carrier protein
VLIAQFPRDSIEATVAAQWHAVTGTAPGTIDEHFFEHGHSSLQAARLIARIRAEFGLDVSVNAIFEMPTVAGLAAAIRANRSGVSYVQRVQEGDGVPLVLAPGPSGGPGWMSRLAVPALGRPVYSLAARGAHGESAPLDEPEAIGRHLLESLRRDSVQGPVHLVGNCTARFAALEMARLAADYGIVPLTVTMLNSAAHVENPGAREMVRLRLSEIRGLAGLDDPAPRAAQDAPSSVDEMIAEAFAEVKDSPAIMEATVEAFETRVRVFVGNWHAAAAFRPTPLPAAVHLMYNPDLAAELDVAAWKNVGYADLTLTPVAGLRHQTIGDPEMLAELIGYLDGRSDSRVANTGGRS